MVVLDTTFLIALEQESPPARQRLRALEAEGAPLRVPAATWIEYLFALEPPRRAAAVARLEAGSSFQPVTREIADEAVRLQASLSRAGRRVAWHDLQVAATARYLREPLVTNDAAFRGIPDLELLDH